MKPRKKTTLTRRRASLQNIGMFTLVDEMLASPTEPWPESEFAARVMAARASLERLQVPRPATAFGSDWAVLTMVGNLVTVLLERGHIADPDGLLADARAALQAPLERYTDRAGLLSISAAEARVVGFVIDDWDEVMRGLPARTMVRACRECERRVAAIDNGRPLRTTDVSVSMLPRVAL